MKNPPILIRQSNSKLFHNQNTHVVGTSSYYYNVLLRAELNICNYISRLKWLSVYNNQKKFNNSKAPVILGLYPINTFFRAKQFYICHLSLSKSLFWSPFINYAAFLSKNPHSHINPQINLIKDLCLQFHNLGKKTNFYSNNQFLKYTNVFTQIKTLTPNTEVNQFKNVINNTKSKKTFLGCMFLLTCLALLIAPTSFNTSANFKSPRKTNSLNPLLRRPLVSLRHKSFVKQDVYLQHIVTQALTLELIHNTPTQGTSILGYKVINNTNFAKTGGRIHKKALKSGNSGVLKNKNVHHKTKYVNLHAPQLQQTIRNSVEPCVLVNRRPSQHATLHLVSPLEERLNLARFTKPKPSLKHGAKKRTHTVYKVGTHTRRLNSLDQSLTCAKQWNYFPSPDLFSKIIFKNQPHHKLGAVNPTHSYFNKYIKKSLNGLQRLKHGVVFELGIANDDVLIQKLNKHVKSKKALHSAAKKPMLNLKNSLSIRF